MSRLSAALLSAAVLLAASSVSASADPALREVFGSPGTGVGEFEHASGVAVDASDRVFVADCLLNRVSIFRPDRSFLGQLGGPFAGGPAPAGSGPRQFVCPSEIDTDGDDYVYVVDRDNRRVQRFAGLDSDVPLDYIQSLVLRGTDQRTCAPYDVTVDPARSVWIVGGGGPKECQVVAKFDRSGRELLRFGRYGEGPGEFRGYMHVAADAAGDVFVSDFVNHRVQKFDAGGWLLSSFGGPGSGAGDLLGPHGVTVDPAGNLWVAEAGVNFRIQQFSATGASGASLGGYGAGPGEFTMAYDVAADSNCNIYAIDTSGVSGGPERVQVFGEPKPPFCVSR